MNDNDMAKKPWFKRIWGIALIALGGLTGLFMMLVVISGVVYAISGREALEVDPTSSSAGVETTTVVEAPTTTIAETTTTLPPSTRTAPETATTQAPTTTIPETTTTQAPTTTSTTVVAEPEQATTRGHNLDGPWTMPDLVGENLQDAQDIIQAVTYGGIVVTHSHDATEDERSQLVDAGWTVCDQSFAPGDTITRESLIDFGVVRVIETCP